ncbi:signal peptidase II [Aestuariirhabdus sp. Z084]|uniref:signal peptidase II n=1 Tax=Aestuariirhabdus haliotis TaxID=2918751 RepID=UPI00201B4488|nr:signal peptidase II [Aestuariirhabdus haliotis]MCL6416190.1 signal peptidase II [Aestuariirhabdus haliotis]MCL6420242.1 signal peptidase II [Aestuariirhabdus haliotis]
MLRWLWLTVLVVVLDQLSKHYVVGAFELYERVSVLPMFDFTLAYNTGAAFSFLSDASGWQRWFFAAIALGVSLMLVFWLKSLKQNERWLAIALALVLGGALGNLYDRVVLGHVVDFILVYYQNSYFPAFNIADSAITLGAFMLILDAIRNRDSAKETEN